MFYRFLIARDLVTPEHIVECLDLQAEVTPRLGLIALWSGHLRMSQIWKILEHQAELGGLFGDVAIELGFLDTHERDALVLEQIGRRPSLEELLVERGYVDAEALRRAKREWAQDHRRAALSVPRLGS